MLAGLLGYLYQGALARKRRETRDKAAHVQTTDDWFAKAEAPLWVSAFTAYLAAFALFVAGGLVVLVRVA